MIRVGLVLGSAGLYALCFPPASLRPLAALALAPFFAAAARSSVLGAAGLGLLWGAAATLGVTSWLPGMLGDFFGASRAAGIAGLAALGVFGIGPAYAAFAAWLAWSARRRPPTPWEVGAAWLGAEWLRSHGPLGSPWALAGYAVVDTPFAQTADLAGPAGPGFLVALANAALASFAAPGLRPRRVRLHAAAAALLIAAAGLYGAARLAAPFGEGPPLRVAVVQGGVTWGYHFDPARSEPNLRRYLELHEAALARAPQLVVWPEHAIDFYLHDPSPQRAALSAALAGREAELVLGAPHYTRVDGTTRYLNSVFLLSGGEVAGRSDKTKLVPFAERSPFGALLPAAGGAYAAGRPARAAREDGGAGRVPVCRGDVPGRRAPARRGRRRAAGESLERLLVRLACGGAAPCSRPPRCARSRSGVGCCARRPRATRPSWIRRAASRRSPGTAAPPCSRARCAARAR